LLPKDGSAILYVGCGNGSFANYLIEQGYKVYGIRFLLM
jgi:2-polyprenyl-6-hydroxyphenyl methylase/3-demethylubiquinone-9 3-methyltransferase